MRVVEALLELFSFETVYIADLDAIRSRSAGHDALLMQLTQRFNQVEFWIDRGVQDEAAFQALIALRIGVPVIGSESITQAQWLANVEANAALLSLDFRGEAFLGPPELLQQPALWPRRLLAMNLARVGSGEGADLDLIARLQRLAPQAQVFAAGGVRHVDDLLLLREQGCAGALVATALHDGRIDGAALRRLGESEE